MAIDGEVRLEFGAGRGESRSEEAGGIEEEFGAEEKNEIGWAYWKKENELSYFKVEKIHY